MLLSNIAMTLWGLGYPDQGQQKLQEGLAFLARNMPGLELDGEPVYGSITGLYGMESLPIRWSPEAPA